MLDIAVLILFLSGGTGDGGISGSGGLSRSGVGSVTKGGAWGGVRGEAEGQDRSGAGGEVKDVAKSGVRDEVDAPYLYKLYCSSCHGANRLGWSAPPLIPHPLIPQFLKTDKELWRIIKEGSRNMPAFPHLTDEEIKSLIEFIKSPADKIEWSEKDIRKSRSSSKLEKVNIENVKDITLVVERGENSIWIMENDKVLSKFPFPHNIHGGIKFSKDGKRAYIPSREGWIGLINIDSGDLKKIKACIYLRNIALSPDGKILVASCWLPTSLVIFDGNLNFIKTLPIEGKISAVYELWTKHLFLFTIIDKPVLGMMDKDLKVKYIDSEIPLREFAIDPLEKYLIGGTESELVIYNLQDMSIKRIKSDGIPHLASAYFWYSKGDFYFITPILNKHYASIWKAYKWEHVKDIPLGGQGFLARSNYKTPYIWIDTNSDTMLLVDKRTFEVRWLKLHESNGSNGKFFNRKKATHVEFSEDGNKAYVSIYREKENEKWREQNRSEKVDESEKLEGEIAIYDAVSLTKLNSIPANLPAGKYNFFNKLRYYDGYGLGYQVFMEKCRGCHDIDREAFGPPLKQSAKKRNIDILLSQISNPEKTYKILGYEKNSMPKIPLSDEELLAIKRFLEVLKNE